MPGPNFIHVEDATTCVVGVFTTSRTPIAGVTEYNETHPLFRPALKSTRWKRTGVNTYVNNGPDPLPPPEERELTTWVQSGGCENIREPNGVTTAAWGHEESLAGVTMFRDGEIVGWSVAYEGVPSAGTCTFTITIDGILQNGDPQYELVVSLANGSNRFSNFDPPLAFNQGQIINAVATSSGFAASGMNDATLSMWYRDR